MFIGSCRWLPPGRNWSEWRQDYNTIRPHGSLGRNTPAEFAEAHNKKAEAQIAA